MSTPKRSDQPATPGKSSLAARIESESSHPLAWKTVVTRAALVIVAGVALYLVFPAITEVLASWPRLSTLNPWWFAVAVGAETAHFACTFALQRLALRTRAWFPVVTSQLAGNAITLGLALMATTLLILFFVGLGQLAPSSPGKQIKLSDATALISARAASSVSDKFRDWRALRSRLPTIDPQVPAHINVHIVRLTPKIKRPRQERYGWTTSPPAGQACG